MKISEIGLNFFAPLALITNYLREEMFVERNSCGK